MVATTRAVRSDGERSRREILHTAAQLATLRGIDRISIGELAAAVGMSKSGLYAHFGSKEELQLATIATAEEIFEAEVLAPARRVPVGRDGLIALADAFLAHLRNRVFPGGCFFVGAVGRAARATRPRPRPHHRLPGPVAGADLAAPRGRPRAGRPGGRTRTWDRPPSTSPPTWRWPTPRSPSWVTRRRSIVPPRPSARASASPDGPARSGDRGSAATRPVFDIRNAHVRR